MAATRLCFLASLLAIRCNAEHQAETVVAKRQNGGGGNIPLLVANWCANDVYPGILTQANTGPSTAGFHLAPNANQTLYVSNNWQGRVWGRTNCSFDSSGQAQGGGGSACSTGDCGGALQCKIAGSFATLAEFNMAGSESSSFYDISLVDGYNLPLAIMMLPNGNSKLEGISQSTTNPSCVASVGDLAPQNFNPYNNGQQFLGTSSKDPLAFETKNDAQAVSNFCPWDLQSSPPSAPGNGVYPYPDGNVQRPPFDPCMSACSKYHTDTYCCTGKYDGPGKCGPNYYSKAAKSVCPDAYSYAYDDATSTFAVPQGAGFQVIFCPGGRSTNILATRNSQTSGSSSNASDFVLSVGGVVIDGRALKVALVALATIVYLIY